MDRRRVHRYLEDTLFTGRIYPRQRVDDVFFFRSEMICRMYLNRRQDYMIVNGFCKESQLGDIVALLSENQAFVNNYTEQSVIGPP